MKTLMNGSLQPLPSGGVEEFELIIDGYCGCYITSSSGIGTRTFVWSVLCYPTASLFVHGTA